MDLGLISVFAGQPSAVNTRNEFDLGIAWVNDATFGYLPRALLRVRSHGALTTRVPYMYYYGNATYVGPLTAAAATSAQALVGIASETTSGAAWTRLIVAGYVDNAVTSGTVTAADDVEVVNAGAALIDAGQAHPTLSANGIGYCMVTASGNVADVWLLGKYVNLAAS
jgi:hypothetical protein